MKSGGAVRALDAVGLDGTLLYRFPTCIKDPCMKVPSKTHILCTSRTDVGTEIEADTEIDADAFKHTITDRNNDKTSISTGNCTL